MFSFQFLQVNVSPRGTQAKHIPQQAASNRKKQRHSKILIEPGIIHPSGILKTHYISLSTIIPSRQLPFSSSRQCTHKLDSHFLAAPVLFPASAAQKRGEELTYKCSAEEAINMFSPIPRSTAPLVLLCVFSCRSSARCKRNKRKYARGCRTIGSFPAWPRFCLGMLRNSGRLVVISFFFRRGLR